MSVRRWSLALATLGLLAASCHSPGLHFDDCVCQDHVGADGGRACWTGYPAQAVPNCGCECTVLADGGRVCVEYDVVPSCPCNCRSTDAGNV